MIPHPIPGLRLGLANVMTLIALVTLGFGASMEVSVLRTILSSFVMGTFMSPSFILSFSAALASTLVMGLLYWLLGVSRRVRLSIVGISVLSALSHNLIQLGLAYLILVRNKGIFVFLPWLAIGAVIMGWITGIVAGSVCRRIKEAKKSTETVTLCEPGSSAFQLQHYFAGNSFFHRLGADTKIIGIFILSLAVLIFSNFWLYLGLSLFLIIAALVSRASLDFIFLKLKKNTSLVFASFLFPVFFSPGNHADGFSRGGVFAFRIIFLITASSLLIRTTSPQDLARGLTKVLSPLRFFGVSQERMALILSLAWMALPLFWQKAGDAIRQQDFKKMKGVRNLMPALADIVAGLYLDTEQVYGIWENSVLVNKPTRKES